MAQTEWNFLNYLGYRSNFFLESLVPRNSSLLTECLLMPKYIQSAMLLIIMESYPLCACPLEGTLHASIIVLLDVNETARSLATEHIGLLLNKKSNTDPKFFNTMEDFKIEMFFSNSNSTISGPVTKPQIHPSRDHLLASSR